MTPLLLSLLLAAAPDIAPIPVGAGERTIDVAGKPLTLFTYKAADGKVAKEFNGSPGLAASSAAK